MKITRIEDLIIEVRGYDREVLRKITLSSVFDGLLDLLDTILLQRISHTFHPVGETMVGIISASHLAIHTYPEFNYLYVNLNSCQPLPDLEQLRRFLGETLHADEVVIHRRSILL